MLRVVLATCSCAMMMSLHGCGGGDDKTTITTTTSATTTTTTTTTPLIGSCGMKGADIADCQVDFGSCGNACCRLQATIGGSLDDVAQNFNRSLLKGGADSGFSLQPLFGIRGVGTGGHGFEALSIGGYIGHVYHTTSGENHFNDTINFHLASEDNITTTVMVFSVSQIGGALGDAGQNYKNIIMALNGANFGEDTNTSWDGTVQHMDKSCPISQVPARPSRQETVSTRRLNDVVGSCGFNYSSVADCKNVDLGSCGNACCSLEVMVPAAAVEVVKMLNDSFADGGADGAFTPSMTYEQTLGFANLTGLPPQDLYPGEVYIGQVTHTTSGKWNFNDTLNFNLVPSDDGKKTIITAFSVSTIGGAYADNGQNFKNLKMVMDHAFEDSYVQTTGTFASSCPQPAPTMI